MVLVGFRVGETAYSVHIECGETLYSRCIIHVLVISGVIFLNFLFSY